MIPPQGFSPSKRFTGFEQPEAAASVMVSEMSIPKNASPSVLEQLSSADTLRTKGMQLIEAQDVKITGDPAKLLLVKQLSFLKWIGAVARGDRTLLVVATFPEGESKKLREPLRQAILTLNWQPDIAINLWEGLPFQFQERGDLKVADRISNTVVLAKNGAKPPIPPTDPLLVIGSAYSVVEIKDIAKFSRERLQQMPQVRGVVESSNKRLTLAGQPAFELIARGYDLKTGTPLTIYQVIITTKVSYYILQGMVGNRDASKYLGVFREVANSFIPQE